MKTSRLSLTLLCVFFYAVATAAQPYSRTKTRRAKDTIIVKNYIDSLLVCKSEIYTSSEYDSVYANGRTLYLFAQPTFYKSVAGDILANDNKNDYGQTAINRALMNIYLFHPNLIEKSENRLNSIGAIHKEIKAPIRKKEILSEIADDTPLADNSISNLPVELIVSKPNFWTVSGDYYLQMLQNYVSSNWYKGGESNYSMVASITMQANYNNKQKVKFDNKLEMKLGFQTSRGDTVHSFKTSEDLIRYTGKLGLQASKKWYYSLQLIAYTQFMRGYKSNDTFVYSDILSPLNVNLSIGMDYNASWFGKKLTGTIHLAPLAYNFKYVGRKSLATRYGLDEGKHTLNDFGSECTIDLTWAFSNTLKWKTRLYGYTTYKRAELEWENTLSFQFNKYITSNIFVYPRFDDGAKKDDDHGYWQLKEYASIGFAYSF